MSVTPWNATKIITVDITNLVTRLGRPLKDCTQLYCHSSPRKVSEFLFPSFCHFFIQPLSVAIILDIEPSPSSAEDLNWQFTCQLFRYQSDHLDNKTAGVAVSRNRNRGETKLFQIFSRLFLEQETKNSTDGQQSATCSKRISGRNICGTKMYLHELSIKMNEMVFAQHSDEPMKYQFLKQDYTLHMFVRCLLVSVIAFTLTL